MHFLTHKQSGRVYLDRLEVVGYASDSACNNGAPDHEFDSQKNTHWASIWEKRTPALFGTLHTFIRTQRNGSRRAPHLYELCDSHEVPFASTVNSAFNKGKKGCDTWVKDIIGIVDARTPDRPLIRENFEFKDERKNGARRFYVRKSLPFQIETTFEGRNSVSDAELELIESAIFEKYQECAPRPPMGGVQFTGQPFLSAPVDQNGPRNTHQVFYRKGDLDRALKAFADPRPLFIKGTEGIGKTSLAKELGNRWLQSCGKGRSVIWIDAALQKTTLTMLFCCICNELSFPALQREPLDTQAKELQSRLQKEPLLIVIENFEMLDNVHQVFDFIEVLKAPNRVIATGDDTPLGFDRDFASIRLHPMTSDEMGYMFDFLADSFDLDASLRSEREKLIDIVGGHPGAMVKAVFCLRDLFSIDDILQPGFFDDIFPRTWSRLYPEYLDRCRVLLALACFPFGATRAALASVTQLKPEAFQSGLASLRGLIEISSMSGRPRFSLPSSLAFFVRNRAQTDLPNLEYSLKLQQVKHYVEFTSQIGHCWDELEKMDPLDEIPEQQTISEIITFCENRGMWAEMAKIAKGCRYHAYTRGHWVGPDSILNKWYLAACKLDDITQQFEAGTYLLNIQSKQQDSQGAESIKKLDRLKNKAGSIPENLIIRYLHAKALHCYSAGSFSKAETLWNEGISRNNKRGRKKDEHDQSAMVRWKGLCLLKQGRVKEARIAFEEHLNHAKKHSFTRPALVARLNLEEVRFTEGDMKEVVKRLRDMAPEIENMHDLRLFADHRWLMGQSLFHCGEFNESKAALLDAVDAYGRLGFMKRLGLATDLLSQVNGTESSEPDAQ